MNKIILNQALHGYDHGHGLIESSIQISSDAKRNLMIMSDMSGSSMLDGFEEYITGYPVKEMNLYALAKTWNAPEMKRPGCVWTHTLLINFTDLIKLENISTLLKLFRKPSDDTFFNFYSQPLEIVIEGNTNNANIISNNNLDSAFIKEIIFQLYKSNNSVLIQSQDALKYESIILSIWLQQWPRLKRNFTFCTGSIAPRSLNNKLLDIQVIPFNNDRSIKEKDKIVILNPVYNPNTLKSNWVDLIYNDLIISSDKLKQFFNYFGADVREERSALVSLVEIYMLLNSNNNVKINELIKTFSDYFPQPTDAFTLKKSVLSDQNAASPLYFTSYNEELVLFELAKTEFYKSFDFKNLEFGERFQKLFRNSPKSVLNILDKLISSDINPNGEIVLKAIAQIIKGNELELLNQNYRKLLLVFIFFNPELAYYKKFWEVGDSEQNENLSTLLKASNVNWQKVFGCILEMDIRIDKEIIFNSEFNIVSIILDLVNKTAIKDLSYYWLDVLKDKPEEILKWINESSIFKGEIFRLIPQILNPNSQLIFSTDINSWLKLVDQSHAMINHNDKIKFKAFILAVSFNLTNEAVMKLISYSFEDVYKAALDSNLDYSSWKSLEVHTKPLPFWKEWDKCKKLRNALIDKFFENRWSINLLYKIFSDKEILQKMISKYEKSR